MASDALKIGLVLDDSIDKTDGVQQYILAIGGWLSSQGHDVHYLVGQSSRTDLNNVHSLSRNINVQSNGNRMSIPLPTSRRKLRAFLAREKFDVLHVQTPYSPYMAHRLIMAADDSTAVIGTFHIVAYSPVVTFGTKVLAHWVRRSVRRFDDMVSVSSAAVSYAKDTYGIDTAVLPNVVDYQRFHKAKPLLPPTTKPRVLFLGRLVERKGCRYLLEAVKTLAADPTVPDFEVVICGKGPLLSSLENYVNDNGLNGMVQFAGYVSEDDKPGYYASADISVFPSTGGESFGIVLLEAMASGKSAVLAASNSGYASVMQARPDLLVPTADGAALAERLGALLRDKTSRHDAANWGEQYTKQFDTAVVGQQLLERYRLALRKRRGQ